MTNYGPDEIMDLNTPFERSLSKLSENHKISKKLLRSDPQNSSYGNCKSP